MQSLAALRRDERGRGYGGSEGLGGNVLIQRGEILSRTGIKPSKTGKKSPPAPACSARSEAAAEEEARLPRTAARRAAASAGERSNIRLRNFKDHRPSLDPRYP